MPWDQLLGPLGFLAGSLIAIGVLWRLVREYITELKASRDRWRTLAEGYGPKFDQQTDALRILPSIAATLERLERRLEK